LLFVHKLSFIQEDEEEENEEREYEVEEKEAEGGEEMKLLCITLKHCCYWFVWCVLLCDVCYHVLQMKQQSKTLKCVKELCKKNIPLVERHKNMRNSTICIN
jgi:hypothetical protein